MREGDKKGEDVISGDAVRSHSSWEAYDLETKREEPNHDYSLCTMIIFYHN